ncbi:MAG: SufD family Fe-S cluster assembly protein [Candidatus Omnitrophota bacterium]|jgi:hypothetical protein
MSPKEIEKHFSQQDKDKISSSGMDFTEKTRSASFLQEDAKVLVARALQDSMEIISTQEALGIPQFKEHFGKAFKALGREYPAETEGGYCIRVKKGKTVQLPIQACLFLKAQGFKQRVHNIVIVEEGAKVYLITGCSASKAAHEGFHLGVSEFFIQRGGYLNFTMIHSWSEDVSVKPMSIAMVEDEGTFVSNYICLKPVREVVMYPTAFLKGKNSRASFNSLILSHPGSFQDIGSRAILKGDSSQAEIVSRAVSLGGKVIARGHLKAQSHNVKGHLECRGLVLSEKGTIYAIPELETELRDVDLSHEAAIGKINKEEIEYLCSRGLSASEAQAVIVRGFMDVDILALPELLRKEIKELEDKILGGAF